MSATAARNGSIGGGVCNEYAGFAPAFYQAKGLPTLPIKTLRVIFHVIQKDDGSENWKEPSRDMNADETILRGYINGLNQWPAGGQPIRGVNGIYSQLDARMTAPVVPVTPFNDTRIRFQVDAVRYYRSTSYWNMSNGSNNRFPTDLVTNSASNPDVTGQPTLNDDQKNNVIHVFFGENPGPPGAPLDQFGHSVSRYGIGGAAGGLPSKVIQMRGHYWALRNHPYWGAPGQPTNTGDQQAAFRYSVFVLAHELGHCLGLEHAFDRIDCTSGNTPDPPALTQGASNNLMDYPGLPGLSLSQCQIGLMHTMLSNSFVDDVQVRDHWLRWTGTPTQDNVIRQSQEWNSIHNLRGDLYVEAGAVLTVHCRVGMLGPTAKIVVRRGGQLIFDGGSLGKYATSDVNEAPQDLTLRLGGDPADPNDADRTGLIEFRNAGCRLTSTRTFVELTAGATLHLAGGARLELAGSQLRTLPGSFLCVAPTARISQTAGGTYTVAPGTLGFGPNVGVVPSPLPSCAPDLCVISSQGLAIAGSVAANTAFCPSDGPVTLSVGGLPQPLPSGYSFQWLLDGVALASQTGTTLAHTLPDNRNATPLTRMYGCRVQPPGCPAVTLTYPVVLNAWVAAQTAYTTTITVPCATVSSGPYNLTQRTPDLFGGLPNPNIGIATWSGPFVTTDDGNGGGGGAGPPYYFNVAAAVRSGATRFTVFVAAQPLVPGNRCPASTAITIILQLSPSLSLVTDGLTVCPGQVTTLRARVPVGCTVQWQPGNATGNTFVANPTVTTTYTAVVTDANGCENQQYVTVDVRPATCGVCEPAVVPMNPVDLLGGAVTNYISGYTFLGGSTYLFSRNTTFDGGQFVAQPGARLLFDPEVVLTLAGNACLVLNGATLTAVCDAQWGGIRVTGNSGITAFIPPSGIIISVPNEGPAPPSAPVPVNEISHSTGGIEVVGPASFAKTTCSKLNLDGVRFRHNLLAVTIFCPDQASSAFVVVRNCTFEADPRQMLAPYAYVSAERQWCAGTHLYLSGNLRSMVLTRNTFDGALFGLYSTGIVPAVSRNTFTNCYLAGAMSRYGGDPYLGDPTTWTNNVFTLPGRNLFSTSAAANPFVAAHYALLASFSLATPRLPREISEPGNVVGLYAKGEPLTVTGNRFAQPGSPTDAYTWDNPAPRTGLWAGPGTVLLRNNAFENLHLGAAQQAQQPAGGLSTGNTFVDCRTSLAFLNRYQAPNNSPGNVRLACNTFERRAVNPGSSFAVYLGPGQYAPGQAGQQVNIAEELLPGNSNYTPILQTNRFVGLQPPPADPRNVQTYWHVLNDSYNLPFMYCRYNASADLLNPVVVAGDATVANAVVLRIKNTIQYQPGVNDCATLGYPAGVGLRPAPTGTGPAIAPYYLAQNAPNPCSGSTSVSYRLPAAETGELVVRDAFGGRVWLRQALGAGERTMELRLDKLLPGAYHYSLEVNGRPVAHHQLLVQ